MTTALYTAQEYCPTFAPSINDLFRDPEQCYRELTQEADELADQVGLGVHPEGRYSEGLWDLIMMGPLPMPSRAPHGLGLIDVID
jgi:hypothetical protein